MSGVLEELNTHRSSTKCADTRLLPGFRSFPSSLPPALLGSLDTSEFLTSAPACPSLPRPGGELWVVGTSCGRKVAIHEHLPPLPQVCRHSMSGHSPHMMAAAWEVVLGVAVLTVGGCECQCGVQGRRLLCTPPCRGAAIVRPTTCRHVRSPASSLSTTSTVDSGAVAALELVRVEL
jgi:hypothetical protein